MSDYSQSSQSDSQQSQQQYQNYYQSPSSNTRFTNIQLSLQITHNFHFDWEQQDQSSPFQPFNFSDQINFTNNHQFIAHFQQLQLSDDHQSDQSSSFAEQEFQYQPPAIFEAEQDDSIQRESPFFSAIKQQGLQWEQIKAIPTMVWSQMHQKFNKGEKCSVCLQEYEVGRVLRVMPCLHRYHMQCLDEWLQMRANCPNCRTDVNAE